jgi:carotenoid cleavage dioxygenase
MCAHHKTDPATGELVVFRYDIEAPFLSRAVLGADGSVARPETPVDGVDAPFMIHDSAVTPHWVVLVVAPALIDLAAMGTGRDVLRWEPERGTRVALTRGPAPVGSTCSTGSVRSSLASTTA